MHTRSHRSRRRGPTRGGMGRQEELQALLNNKDAYPNVKADIKEEILTGAISILKGMPKATRARIFERSLLASMLAVFIAGSVVTAGATTGALGLGIIFGGLAGLGGVLQIAEGIFKLKNPKDIEAAKDRVYSTAIAELEKLNKIPSKEAQVASATDSAKKGQKLLGEVLETIEKDPELPAESKPVIEEAKQGVENLPLPTSMYVSAKTATNPPSSPVPVGRKTGLTMRQILPAPIGGRRTRRRRGGGDAMTSGM